MRSGGTEHGFRILSSVFPGLSDSFGLDFLYKKKMVQTARESCEEYK